MRSNPVRCDLENSGLEIDIRPVQAEYLALAEAQRECNRPSCSVTAFPSRTEDALNLRDGVGLKLLGFDFRCLREGTRDVSQLTVAFSGLSVAQ
jgi:hypothetical protein